MRKSQKSELPINRRNFMVKSGFLGSIITLGSLNSLMGEENKVGVENSNIVDEVPKRKLGDLEVSAIGLGCMSMTSGHYNPPRSKKEMFPVLQGAFERGISFFDTAEYYGPFTNETFVGEALTSFRKDLVLATKLGFKFENNKPTGRSSRPEHLRSALEGMLKRLRTDYIDLLYIHRVDPELPIEDVAGTMGEFIREGKILHYGLSEVSPETLRRAHKTQKVTALQSEYSLVERLPENQVLATCEELGIGFVPWGPVCRGFLADKFNEYSRFSDNSRFASVPYYTPEAIEKNMELLDLIRKWSVKKGVTPAQFSLAWLLAQKPWIVPIPGTTKLHHVEENLRATGIQLTKDELNQFRNEFSSISLIGIRKPEEVLKDK